MKVRVFLFHRIHPAVDPLWQPIHPQLFAQQLQHIARTYNVIKVADLAQASTIKSGKPLAVITFDDGYKDFLDYALPLLQKLHLPASMYIVTDCATGGFPPWTYQLDYVFRFTAKLGNTVADLLPTHLQVKTWSSAHERVAFATKLKALMKIMPDEQRRLLFHHYLSAFNDVVLPTGLMMNWSEIREINAAGIEIGSHTVSHPNLSSLENAVDLEKEMQLSRSIIQQQILNTPISVSYPAGYFNEAVKNAAKQAGYKLAFAVKNSIYETGTDDLYEIPRIELYNESMMKFKLREMGWMNTIKKMIGR